MRRLAPGAMMQMAMTGREAAQTKAMLAGLRQRADAIVLAVISRATGLEKGPG